MCGFFAFAPGHSAEEIGTALNLWTMPKAVREEMERMESLKFYPKSFIPTVSKNSPNQLKFRYWSLVPRWWKQKVNDLKFSTFNARAEDLDTKATYRTPWKLGQRCLIPATWFYEFETIKTDGKLHKAPYRVEDSDESIITLAGLYEVLEREGDDPFESATIITCSSEGTLKKVHARQPVIIKKEDRERWLSKDTPLEDVASLLKADDDLKVEPIDPAFNKTFGDAVTEGMVKGE